MCFSVLAFPTKIVETKHMTIETPLPTKVTWKGPRDGLRLLATAAIAVAGISALPMIAVLLAAFMGGTETVRHLLNTVLLGYAGTTLLLVVMVATGTFLVGVRFLEIALVLPLAFPAYVLAYAYTHVLDHPGIVQSTLRDVTGWGPRDYWFPEIRSLGGAALMLVLVLYPYVYLLARAAFLQQSATTFLAARALGSSAWVAFYKVSLPDFGTVAYLGFRPLPPVSTQVGFPCLTGPVPHNWPYVC